MRGLFGFLLAFLLFSGGRALALKIPGTPYEMDFPSGFVARGSGLLLNEATGSRLRVERFPLSVQDQLKHFSPEALQKKNTERISEESFEAADLKGTLITLKAPGLTQLALVLSHGGGSVLFLASIPLALEGELGAVKSALSTLRLSDSPWFDPFAGLPFAFNEPEGKKFVRRQGSVVVFSRSGQSPDPEGEILLIAREEIEPGEPQEVFLSRVKTLGLGNSSPEGKLNSLALDGRPALWAVFPFPGLKNKKLFRGMVWGNSYQVTFSGFCPRENENCVRQLEASFRGFKER